MSEWTEKQKQIISDIKYELFTGLHTRHQCDCGRQSCRSTCMLCLCEDFAGQNEPLSIQLERKEHEAD